MMARLSFSVWVIIVLVMFGTIMADKQDVAVIFAFGAVAPIIILLVYHWIRWIITGKTDD